MRVARRDRRHRPPRHRDSFRLLPPRCAKRPWRRDRAPGFEPGGWAGRDRRSLRDPGGPARRLSIVVMSWLPSQSDGFDSRSPLQPSRVCQAKVAHRSLDGGGPTQSRRAAVGKPTQSKPPHHVAGAFTPGSEPGLQSVQRLDLHAPSGAVGALFDNQLPCAMQLLELASVGGQKSVDRRARPRGRGFVRVEAIVVPDEEAAQPQHRPAEKQSSATASRL